MMMISQEQQDESSENAFSFAARLVRSYAKMFKMLIGLKETRKEFRTLKGKIETLYCLEIALYAKMGPSFFRLCPFI